MNGFGKWENPKSHKGNANGEKMIRRKLNSSFNFKEKTMILFYLLRFAFKNFSSAFLLASHFIFNSHLPPYVQFNLHLSTFSFILKQLSSFSCHEQWTFFFSEELKRKKIATHKEMMEISSTCENFLLSFRICRDCLVWEKKKILLIEEDGKLIFHFK